MKRFICVAAMAAMTAAPAFAQTGDHNEIDAAYYAKVQACLDAHTAVNQKARVERCREGLAQIDAYHASRTPQPHETNMYHMLRGFLLPRDRRSVFEAGQGPVRPRVRADGGFLGRVRARSWTVRRPPRASRTSGRCAAAPRRPSSNAAMSSARLAPRLRRESAGMCAVRCAVLDIGLWSCCGCAASGCGARAELGDQLSPDRQSLSS